MHPPHLDGVTCLGVRELLDREYKKLKRLASPDLLSHAVTRQILETVRVARGILDRIERTDLKSAVRGKSYFGFRGAGESRPVNKALFVEHDADLEPLLRLFERGFEGATEEDIVRSIYTIAYSLFAANDSCEVGRKASATFFEILIGHAVARAMGVSPRKRVRLPESQATLPTDYVFDPGLGRRKVHLPIKTSTRERAVQAWVHQLVLDGIFAKGSFVGVFVVGAETKRNTKTGEVIEICVPQQLAMFQARIATISGIYYLDPPEKYLQLARGNAIQPLHVESFGRMFHDLRLVDQG